MRLSVFVQTWCLVGARCVTLTLLDVTEHGTRRQLQDDFDRVLDPARPPFSFFSDATTTMNSRFPVTIRPERN